MNLTSCESGLLHIILFFTFCSLLLSLFAESFHVPPNPSFLTHPLAEDSTQLFVSTEATYSTVTNGTSVLLQSTEMDDHYKSKCLGVWLSESKISSVNVLIFTSTCFSQVNSLMEPWRTTRTKVRVPNVTFKYCSGQRSLKFQHFLFPTVNKLLAC